MNKKIILGILLIVGLFLIFILKTPSKFSQNQTASSTILKIEAPELNISPVTFEPSQNIKEQAWLVLQKYLNFAKNKNIEGLKNVSYQISDPCKNYNQNPENKADCDGRMDTVYSFGQVLKKEDFENVWFDSKQIILSTNFRFAEDENVIGRNRGIIFFMIDKNKEIKLINFNPAKGAILEKKYGNADELKKKLIAYTEDKDQDGAEDYLENCLSDSQGESCLKTSDTSRDSDSNGVWDGIQTLIN